MERHHNHATIFELVDRLNCFTRDDGIAVEVYEECEDGTSKVRVFRPTPGPEPEESIAEVVMGVVGEWNEDYLIQIDLNDDESVTMTCNLPAIVAVLVHY